MLIDAEIATLQQARVLLLGRDKSNLSLCQRASQRESELWASMPAQKSWGSEEALGSKAGSREIEPFNRKLTWFRDPWKLRLAGIESRR
jgi:hypothetical protein